MALILNAAATTTTTTTTKSSSNNNAARYTVVLHLKKVSPQVHALPPSQGIRKADKV